MSAATVEFAHQPLVFTHSSKTAGAPFISKDAVTKISRRWPPIRSRNQTAKRVFKEELAKKTLRILERTTKEDRRLYDMTLECLAE